MGQETPARFRFKSAYKEDYLDKYLSSFEDSQSLVIKSYEITKSKSRPAEAEWFSLATHLGVLYPNFYDTEALRANNLPFEDLRVPPGTPLEVIARVGMGFTDSIYGHGRPCNAEEKKRIPRLCAQKSKDMYIVTSPDIRRQDNVTLRELEAILSKETNRNFVGALKFGKSSGSPLNLPLQSRFSLGSC